MPFIRCDEPFFPRRRKGANWEGNYLEQFIYFKTPGRKFHFVVFLSFSGVTFVKDKLKGKERFSARKSFCIKPTPLRILFFYFIIFGEGFEAKTRNTPFPAEENGIKLFPSISLELCIVTNVSLCYETSNTCS